MSRLCCCRAGLGDQAQGQRHVLVHAIPIVADNLTPARKEPYE